MPQWTTVVTETRLLITFYTCNSIMMHMQRIKAPRICNLFKIMCGVTLVKIQG